MDGCGLREWPHPRGAGAGCRPDRDDEDRREPDRGHERNSGPRPPAAPARAQAAEARARLGEDASVGLLHRGGDTARRKPREEKLLPGPREGRTPALPRLRPPAHLRELALGPGRAHHVRGGPARPQSTNDDAPVVCPLAPGRPRAVRGRNRGAERTKEGVQARPAWAPIGHQKQTGHFRYFGSTRSDWWAVKDSNLGPAD